MTTHVLRNSVAALAAVAQAALISGCASTPVAERTLLLGEVAHVLTRQEILTGDIDKAVDNRGREKVRIPQLPEQLKARGLSDADMQQGSVVLVRFQFYRHNEASGIVREHLRTATVAKGLELRNGNVVELEVQGGYAKAVRLRHADLQQGQCAYRTVSKSGAIAALDAVNPIGGARAASLDCPGLAGEGWTRKPYVYGFEWHKPPTP
jgi:hypothetical protein